MSTLRARRNAPRVNGLRRDPRTGAGKLAKIAARGYETALVVDFTDKSVVNYDKTTGTNVKYSQGLEDVGSYRGPQSVFSFNATPSPKLVLQGKGTSQNGYLAYCGHNLITYSRWVGGTGWSTSDVVVTDDQINAPDGTKLADLVTANSGLAGHNVGNSVTAVIGASYRMAIFVKAGNHNYVYLKGSTDVSHYVSGVFDLSSANTSASETFNSNMSIVSTSQKAYGDGWYRIDVVLNAITNTTTLTINIGFAGAATGNSVNTYGAVQWTAAGTETLYMWGLHCHRYPGNDDFFTTTGSALYAFPYIYDVNGNCDGIWTDTGSGGPGNTNYLTRSSDLSHADWTATNCSQTGSQTDPMGMSTATLITASSGAGTHAVNDTFAAAASTDSWVFSVYLKAGTTNYAYIGVDGATAGLDVDYVIDLSDGSLTQTITAGDSTPIIEALPNGWYRFAVDDTSNGSADNPTFYVGPHDGSAAVSYTAAGTETIYAFGPQAEINGNLGSLMLTYGSTVSRVQDSITLATTAFGYVQGTTTLAYSGRTYQFDAGNGSYVSLFKSGTEFERFYGNTIGRISGDCRGPTGGASNVSFQDFQQYANQDHRMALSAQVNLAEMSFDGSKYDGTDTLYDPCTTCTDLNIRSLSTSFVGAGKTRRVLYLGRVSSQTQLNKISGSM